MENICGGGGSREGLCIDVMLMDLNKPLDEGSQVVLTLLFEDAAGVKTQQEVQAVAKKMAMGSKDKPQHGEHKH